MLATDLQTGLTFALVDDRGAAWPALIQRLHRRRNGAIYAWGVIASGASTGIPWRTILLGHRPVVVLPTHYGLCHACGALAPCPDELTETELRDLLAEWEQHAFIDLVIGPTTDDGENMVSPVLTDTTTTHATS